MTSRESDKVVIRVSVIIITKGAEDHTPRLPGSLNQPEAVPEIEMDNYTT